MSSACGRPETTVIGPLENWAKPSAVTETAYCPGARPLMAYDPSPPEVALPVWPVEDLAVTTAPGITAPVGSVILPRKLPVLCANIAAERMRTSRGEARPL